MKHSIYLDYNASTPVLPEVIDAMLPYLHTHFGNPSSSHPYGQKARHAVDLAREQVATLIGAKIDEIVFTSGGTEANNMAIRSVAECNMNRHEIVTTVIEHPATLKPCAWLEERGWKIHRSGVDAQGQVLLSDLREAIHSETALLTIMHSNNETGVLQPIREASALAHQVGTLVHVDAAQSVGKVPIHVGELGADLMSIAGHKLYAPKGVGALFVKRGTSLVPLLLGASHERGLRPGTENVASIVGLGAACAMARNDLESTAQRIRALRDELFQKLQTNIPGIALNGHAQNRLPNTLNVRFPGVLGTRLLEQAPELAASTGSACHDGHEKASSVIVAMGISPKEALGSVRLSLGRLTTHDDVMRAAEILIRVWREIVHS